jgi:hypothetical protein
MRMPGDERSGRGVMLMLMLDGRWPMADGRWPMADVSGVRSAECGQHPVEAACPDLPCMPPCMRACVRACVPACLHALCGHMWPEIRRIGPFPAAFAHSHGKRRPAAGRSGKVRRCYGWMCEWMGGGLHPSTALRDGFDVVLEIVPE